MPWLRWSRRWLAAGLAAVLLCAQLIAAAHACVEAVPVDEGEPASPRCTVHAEAGAPDDPAQSLLCKAHCSNDARSQADAPAQAAPVVPMLLAVIDWAAAVAAAGPQAAARAHAWPEGDSPPGRPPLYLSFLVLRN